MELLGTTFLFLGYIMTPEQTPEQMQTRAILMDFAERVWQDVRQTEKELDEVIRRAEIRRAKELQKKHNLDK